MSNKDIIKRPNIKYTEKPSASSNKIKKETSNSRIIPITRSYLLKHIDSTIIDLENMLSSIEALANKYSVTTNTNSVKDALNNIAPNKLLSNNITYPTYIYSLQKDGAEAGLITSVYEKKSLGLWGNYSIKTAKLLSTVKKELTNMRDSINKTTVETSPSYPILMQAVNVAKVAVIEAEYLVNRPNAKDEIKSMLSLATKQELIGTQAILNEQLETIVDRIERDESLLKSKIMDSSKYYYTNIVGKDITLDSPTTLASAPSDPIAKILVTSSTKSIDEDTDLEKRTSIFSEQVINIFEDLNELAALQIYNQAIVESGGAEEVEVSSSFRDEPDNTSIEVYTEYITGDTRTVASIGDVDPKPSSDIRDQFTAIDDFNRLKDNLFFKGDVEINGGNIRAGTITAGALQIGFKPVKTDITFAAGILDAANTDEGYDDTLAWKRLSHTAGYIETWNSLNEETTFDLIESDQQYGIQPGNSDWEIIKDHVYFVYAELNESDKDLNKIALCPIEEPNPEKAEPSDGFVVVTLGMFIASTTPRIILSYGTTVINGSSIITGTLNADKITVGQDSLTTVLTNSGQNYSTLAGLLTDAQEDATAALNELTDIGSDDKITSNERAWLLKEWTEILAEHITYDAQADVFGTVEAIDTAQTVLNEKLVLLGTFLNAGVTWTSGTPSWLATIVAPATDLGTGGGLTLRAKFSDYYDARASLISKMVNHAYSTGNSAAQAIGTLEGNLFYPGTTTINGGIIRTGSIHAGALSIGGRNISLTGAFGPNMNSASTLSNGHLWYPGGKMSIPIGATGNLGTYEATIPPGDIVANPAVDSVYWIYSMVSLNTDGAPTGATLGTILRTNTGPDYGMPVDGHDLAGQDALYAYKKIGIWTTKTDSLYGMLALSLGQTYINGGDLITDTVVAKKIMVGGTATDGDNLPILQGWLTSDSKVLTAALDGAVTDVAGATTTMSVFKGPLDDTPNWTFSYSASSGLLPASGNSRTYTLSSIATGTDSGSVTITAVKYGSPNIVKTYSLSKSKKGATGTAVDARVLTVSANSQVIQIPKTGSPTPGTISLTASLGGVLTGSATWTVTSGTITGGLQPAGTGNTKTFTYANMVDDAVTVKAAITSGIEYSDTITIVKVREGTDTYNVLLSNESHPIACDSTGAALLSPAELGSAGKAISDVYVYKGATAQTGVATAPSAGQFKYELPAGGNGTNCTASRVDNNTFCIDTISADSGSLLITITLDNASTVTKLFSWAKIKAPAAPEAPLVPTQQLQIYKKSSARPDILETEDRVQPPGWENSIETVGDGIDPLWTSQATKSADPTVTVITGHWSVPVRMGNDTAIFRQPGCTGVSPNIAITNAPGMGDNVTQTVKVGDMWICTDYPYKRTQFNETSQEYETVDDPGIKTYSCTSITNGITWTATDKLILEGRSQMNGGLIEAQTIIGEALIAGTVTADYINVGEEKIPASLTLEQLSSILYGVTQLKSSTISVADKSQLAKLKSSIVSFYNSITSDGVTAIDGIVYPKHPKNEFYIGPQFTTVKQNYENAYHALMVDTALWKSTDTVQYTFFDYVLSNLSSDTIIDEDKYAFINTTLNTFFSTYDALAEELNLVYINGLDGKVKIDKTGITVGTAALAQAVLNSSSLTFSYNNVPKVVVSSGSTVVQSARLQGSTEIQTLVNLPDTMIIGSPDTDTKKKLEIKRVVDGININFTT